jgi:hypothetical protein
MKDYSEAINQQKEFFAKRAEEIEKYGLMINAHRGLKMGYLKAMIEAFGDKFEFEMVSDSVFRMDKKGKRRKNSQRIDQAEFLSLFKKKDPSV